MNESGKPQKPIHRSWLRLLPYTAFGALLISLTSAESLQSTWIIYGILMLAQFGIIGVYFLINKIKNNKQLNNSKKV